MSYCTVADVSSEFKNTTFTASDNVTDTDVSSFIDQATALIDGYVGKSYVLPVDSSVAGYQVLKMLCINLVAERVRAIMEVKQATNADGNQNPRRPYDMKQAMQTLKDIASQEIQLTGAVQLGGSSGSMFSQNVYDGIEPTFKKGSTQW